MKVSRKLLKKLGLVFFLLALISTVLYGLFLVSKARSFQFFGELIDRVETSEKVIALTFDDGPTEFTDEILEILRKQDIKATFYLIGEDIEKYSDISRQIVEQGHEIGNHTYSHERMILKSQDFIEREIKETDRLIRDAGFQGEITFRPPTGKKFLGLPWYLSEHDIKTIMWDVEPDTYYLGDTEGITNFTVEKTKSGSIILLHPHCITKCQADRDALPKIIQGLQEKGFRFVTVSELLKYRN